MKYQGVILELRSVGYHYPEAERPVFNDITLACSAGSVHGITGANGSGKTTLLNVLSGFLRPSSGSVFYFGRQATPHEPAAVASLGGGLTRTFQVPTVVDELTTLDNLLLGFSCPKPTLREFLHHETGSKEGHLASAHSLLAALGLARHHDSLAGQLSYGLKRLLATGIAIARRTGIILLDEPFANLHPDAAASLAGLIGLMVKDAGSTVLIIDHSVVFLEKVSTQLHELDRGLLRPYGAKAGADAPWQGAGGMS